MSCLEVQIEKHNKKNGEPLSLQSYSETHAQQEQLLHPKWRFLSFLRLLYRFNLF